MPEPVRIKDIPESELTPEQAKVFKDLVINGVGVLFRKRYSDPNY